MRVYILDDEPPAVESIKALLEFCRKDFPFEIVGTSNKPNHAITEINLLKPEVLFLDIEMPTFNGFEILQAINYDKLLIVFVTAYRQYAVEAFAADAFHYIVKPPSPKIFKDALNRIDKQLKKNQFNKAALEKTTEYSNNRLLAIKNNGGYNLLDYDDILYLSSEGAYTNIHLAENKKLTHSKNLKHCTEILPDNLFIRISRSTLINNTKITSFTFQNGGSVTIENEVELLIGKTYRKEVISFLKERFIS